jgi:hypothetical protein
MADLYYAAAARPRLNVPAKRDEIAARTKRMCEIAENTISAMSRSSMCACWSFPSSRMPAPIHDSVEKLRDRLAVPIPNEHTDRYASAVQEVRLLHSDRNLHRIGCLSSRCGVQLDGADRPRRNPQQVSQGQSLDSWELHASPHDFLHSSYKHDPFPVVKTEIGELGVAICYDWLFPETIREIAFKGAEVIIRVSAYMDPWGATPPMDWWTLFNRARARRTRCTSSRPTRVRACGVSAVQLAGRQHGGGLRWALLAQADPGEGEKSWSRRSISSGCAMSGPPRWPRHARACANGDSFIYGAIALRARGGERASAE